MNEDRNQSGSLSLRTVTALDMSIRHFAMSERYREYITENVFPLGPSVRDSVELGKNHRDTLLSSECHHVLLIIWKESPFVTAADLAAVGSRKVFNDLDFNCHSLGRHLAEDKMTVNAATQQVRKYVLIAGAYQLVSRTLSQGRQLELSGTQHLHNLFLAIGAAPARSRTSATHSHPSVISAKA